MTHMYFASIRSNARHQLAELRAKRAAAVPANNIRRTSELCVPRWVVVEHQLERAYARPAHWRNEQSLLNPEYDLSHLIEDGLLD